MSEDVNGVTGNGEDGELRSFLADDSDLDEDKIVADIERRNTGGGKRAGTDTVLSRLAESDPEAADTLKGMQRKMSQSVEETRKLREQVLEMREKMAGSDTVEPRGQRGAPAPPPGVTADNLRLFQQMADFLGYVPRDEVEGQQAESASTSYVQEALRKGIEEYGDEFGYVDEDGSAVVNPEIVERLERRLERLQDPKGGITPLDLYLLEFGGRAAASGSERAGSRPVRRAQVARRSTGGGQKLRIYDEKRGDTAEDVMNRAWVVGKRRMGL